MGILIGVGLAAGLTRFIQTLLLDINPFDPLTYVAVALLVVAVVALAAFVPARRATVIDPIVALRTE